MSLEDLNFKISVNVAEASGAMQGLSTTLSKARVQINDIGGTLSQLPIQKIETASGYFATLSAQTAALKFTMIEVAHGFEAIAHSAHPLEAISKRLSIISGTFTLAAGGAGFLAMTLGTVSSIASYLSVSFMFILDGLRGIAIAARFLTAAFLGLLKVAAIPFRMLIGSLALVGKAIYTVARPFIALNHGIFSLKHSFMNLQLQVVILKQFFSMLPPRMRAVVIGLIALGATGRAGAFAMNVAAKAAHLFGIAATALTRPLKAMKMIARDLIIQMGLLTLAVYRATNALLRFVATSIVSGVRRIASGFWSLTSAVGSAAASIAGSLVSAAASGLRTMSLLGAVTAAWGIKLAAGAETSRVVFGTMLKDMRQGQALLSALEGWKGAPLFNAKAVQDAGRDLLKAGVPVTQIVNRLDQLGQIAVATKTPIEDLSRIYRQGMAKGAFQTDLVNQMAERGIDIYHALERVTGRTGTALAEMISEGKIGAEEMNRAIADLTTGTGIYAGAIDNVANTTAGRWASMLNTAMMTVREFGAELLAAFDMKGAMSSATEIFAMWRSEMNTLQPAFRAMASVVSAAFGAVREIVSVTFSAIANALGLTSGNWMTTFLEWSAIATWSFKQWPDIVTLAFLNVQLSLASAAADFTHFFTGVLPELFRWFGQNWQDVFWNAAKLVGTVFLNIQTNIQQAMLAIWDFIASGGTEPLRIAWTPLLEGFENTLAELPVIPDRAMTALEQQLQSDSAALADALGSSLSDEIAANMQLLEDWQAQQANMSVPVLEDAAAAADKHATDTTASGKASARAAHNKASLVRSQEGQSFISQFLKAGQSNEDKMIAKQDVANTHLNDIKREVRRSPRLGTRRFAT